MVMRRIIAFLATVAMLGGGASALAAPVSPGAQLNRDREQLEREQNQRDFDEGMQRVRDKEAQESAGKSDEAQQEQVTFTLTRIDFEPSEVLEEDAVNAIFDRYLGNEVTVDDLQAIAAAVNKLYADGGYVTCRAWLPPQSIRGGVVRIERVEGKTGKVGVEGNKATKSSYVTNRIGLTPGRVERLNDLNEDILRFNSTNDAQLRIALKPGAEPGTTDYVIAVREPPRVSATVFADNGGNYSSGDVREGVYATLRNLDGTCDSLTLGYVHSLGSNSPILMYRRTLGRSGTRLELAYSQNRVSIERGDFRDLTLGHGRAYSAVLSQPLAVGDYFRSEVGLELSRQTSRTSLFNFPWVDDTTLELMPYYKATWYGAHNVFYQKHGLYAGRTKDIWSDKRNYSAYGLNAIYQKSYRHRQTATLRLTGQWSLVPRLPNARQFYIGGAGSVRGYKESLLSGDHGLELSAEYQFPLAGNGLHGFVFMDWGSVYGGSSFDDHRLMSLGFGVKAHIAKNYCATISLGLPCHRTINAEEQARARVHFMLNGSF